MSVSGDDAEAIMRSITSGEDKPDEDRWTFVIKNADPDTEKNLREIDEMLKDLSSRYPILLSFPVSVAEEEGSPEEAMSDEDFSILDLPEKKPNLLRRFTRWLRRRRLDRQVRASEDGLQHARDMLDIAEDRLKRARDHYHRADWALLKARQERSEEEGTFPIF